jgi:hypothetical protein
MEVLVMKRYLGFAIAIATFVVLVTITAQAQAIGSQTVRASIPFAFNVGKSELPAGEYMITVLNPSSDRKVLQIRSADGRSSAIINTTGVSANISDKAKLVFNRYGAQYFFSEVTMAGDQATFAAVKSNVEKAAQHSLAKNVRKMRVTITAG